MTRRSRTWRVFKWAGTSVCGLIFAMWATSLWLRVSCFTVPVWLLLIDGTLCVRFPGVPMHGNAEDVGVRVKVIEFDPQWALIGEYTGTGFRLTGICVPLWMSFALAAIPTTLLWLFGRRAWPATHCRKCGYDLTGNVSGRCPECGEEI